MTSQTGDLYQDGPSNSDQFIRKWELKLQGSGGTWVISDSTSNSSASGGDSTIQEALRIRFKTRQVNISTRGSLEVTIYNLKMQDLSSLKNLYNRITLSAGYQKGRFGIIFDGTIIKFKQGREQDLTDTYLTLWAQDGDFPYNLATINTSYKAGSTVRDMVNDAVKSFTALGATLGKLINIPEVKLPRGFVAYGMALDKILDYHLQTYINNGKLYIYDPSKAFTVGEPITYNSMSGLVGMPEVTSNGVEFDCLLNPTIQIRGQINIDQKDINQFAAGSTPNVVAGGSTGVQGPAYQQFDWFTNVAADGQYTVFVIEHTGDSRGNPWYTHCVCWPLGQEFGPGTNLPYFNLGPTEQQITAATEAPATPNAPSSPAA